jgi:hypothetical protein
MRVGDSCRKLASNDLAVLVLSATAGVLLHIVTNGQYGFNRDELATLDDARSLAWGYVAYPPVTPFLARVAFILFGPSLVGLRFFAALALGLVLVLTGLMARHLGGGKQAQIVVSIGRGDRRCRIQRVRQLRLPMLGGGCIFHGSPACLRRYSLLSSRRGCDRSGNAHEVRHDVSGRGDCHRRSFHAGQAPSP